MTLDEFMEEVGNSSKRTTGEISFGEFGESLLRTFVRLVRDRSGKEIWTTCNWDIGKAFNDIASELGIDEPKP